MAVQLGCGILIGLYGSGRLSTAFFFFFFFFLVVFLFFVCVVCVVFLVWVFALLLRRLFLVIAAMALVCVKRTEIFFLSLSSRLPFDFMIL